MITILRKLSDSFNGKFKKWEREDSMTGGLKAVGTLFLIGGVIFIAFLYVTGWIAYLMGAK